MKNTRARTLGELVKRIAKGTLSQTETARFDLGAASSGDVLTSIAPAYVATQWASPGDLVLKSRLRSDASTKLLAELRLPDHLAARLAGFDDPDKAVAFLASLPAELQFQAGLLLPDYQGAFDWIRTRIGLSHAISPSPLLVRLACIAWDCDEAGGKEIASGIPGMAEWRSLGASAIDSLKVDFASLLASAYPDSLFSTATASTMTVGSLMSEFADTGLSLSPSDLAESIRLESAVTDAYRRLAECADITELIACVNALRLEDDPALMRKLLIELVMTNDDALRQLGDSETRASQLQEDLLAFEAIKSGAKNRQDAKDKAAFQEAVKALGFIAKNVLDIESFYKEHVPMGREYERATLKGWYSEIPGLPSLKGGRPPKK